MDISLMKTEGLRVVPNTPQEIAKAKRVVCGSQAVEGATDAREILEYLGLIEPSGEKSAVQERNARV